jgi:hypothetical protein
MDETDIEEDDVVGVFTSDVAVGMGRALSEDGSECVVGAAASTVCGIS